ncbi:MAG: protein kinase domain-containing protein [Myxococcaceae bacterium]
MPVREGDVLDGRFEIGPVASSGGMGVVHRGRDLQTGAPVAVKTLRGVEGAERFRREVQVLSGLRHPGIVTYLGDGRTTDELYLVMEWLEGEDLDARLEAAPVNTQDAVRIGIQLASALAAAHAKGIVHRDLKPSNIFLADFRVDRVKLLDYGIARQAGSPTLTEVGMVIGTPAYMSPEQARGDRDIDGRADVYGLGAVLFRCIAGRAPFEGHTPHELLGAVLHRPAPRLSDFAHVPAALDALVSQMLDKTPGRRPSDGNAAWAALSRLASSSTETVASTTVLTGMPPTRRDSGAKPLLSSVAVLPFLDMSAARDQGYLCEGIAEELITTLTQVPALRVAARSSSFALRSADSDARGIGQRLGVDAVLEGGVRKSGDRLRVTVQLVEVAGGSPRWSHRFDGTLDQVFEIQDQIAASVATALRGMLSTEERDALRRPGTRAEAYEHFLRGRQLLHALTRSSREAAEREFRRAIEIDPAYAPAYAGLAQVYSWRMEWVGGSKDEKEAADQASRKALELGPELAEAHVARGDILSVENDYVEAGRSYQEAIRLNPGLFEAYYRYARTCFQSGRLEESVALFLRGAEVRPEDFQCLLLVDLPLRRLGRVDEAVAANLEGLRRVERHLELDPNDPRALILGAVTLTKKDPARALEWAARALAAAPDEPSVTMNAACMYTRLGMKEEALALLAETFGRGLGKRDWIEHDPDYDLLRDDPRFQAMLEKLPRK